MGTGAPSVEPTLRELLEAVPADYPETLRRLLAKLVRTLELHDERLTRIEETPEIQELLP